MNSPDFVSPEGWSVWTPVSIDWAGAVAASCCRFGAWNAVSGPCAGCQRAAILYEPVGRGYQLTLCGTPGHSVIRVRLDWTGFPPPVDDHAPDPTGGGVGSNHDAEPDGLGGGAAPCA